MLEDSKQILILLVVINVALCSYYYLLYRDTVAKKDEDKMLAKLEEKFSNKPLHAPGDIIQPSVCYGFHDKFFDNSKYLGWRQFYLKNQNQQMIEPDTNFNGVITKNFLTNMTSVQNEVTPKEYQIR